MTEPAKSHGLTITTCIMNKIRLITFLCFILVATNVLLIWLLLFKPHPIPQGPKKIISSRLHFSEEQNKNYELLIEKHRKDIRIMDSLILLTKKEYYNCIVIKDSLTKELALKKLGDLQMEIETINYNHFVEIQKICQPNQLHYFDTLVNDLHILFNHKKHRK